MSRNLLNAKKEKNDEFYTRLEDIEKELFHYKEFFKGKILYCNCDNPLWSNFFKFFVKYGEEFGIKEAWFSNYAKDKKKQLTMFDNISKNKGENVAHYWKYIPKLNKTIKKQLKGDGDFRSEECIDLLKQADIVVTNPPFSLFREYVAQLVAYDKKFVIIGNPNSVTYKEIFSLIMNDKIWIGYKSMGTDMLFHVTKEYAQTLMQTKKEGSAYRFVNGELLARAPAIWFTNLETIKRKEDLLLHKHYNSSEYIKYETFDAIDVANVSDIPRDYDGIMGVPKTFLEYYNPTQFEILGYEREDENIKVGIQTIPEEFIFNYRKQGGTGHYTKGMKMLCFYDKDNKAKIPFSRILIRRKMNAN